MVAPPPIEKKSPGVGRVFSHWDPPVFWAVFFLLTNDNPGCPPFHAWGFPVGAFNRWGIQGSPISVGSVFGGGGMAHRKLGFDN